MIRSKRKKPEPRLRGTKTEAATVMIELMRALRHNEFDHNTDRQAAACRLCKLQAKARRLVIKLESAE